jgi:hypothetical protein
MCLSVLGLKNAIGDLVFSFYKGLLPILFLSNLAAIPALLYDRFKRIKPQYHLKTIAFSCLVAWLFFFLRFGMIVLIEATSSMRTMLYSDSVYVFLFPGLVLTIYYTLRISSERQSLRNIC